MCKTGNTTPLCTVDWKPEILPVVILLNNGTGSRLANAKADILIALKAMRTSERHIRMDRE